MKMILGAATVVFAVAMIFLAMQLSGRYRLGQQTRGMVPLLVHAETLGAEAPAEDWQEGDVSYQGVHYRYNKDIMTFLLLGIDRMGEVEAVSDGIDGGEADAVFLLILNPHSKEVSVICVNRDTIAKVEVYDSQGEFLETAALQLRYQYGYGDGAHVSCQRTEALISRLFCGLPINGYCAVNMGGIPEINDAVGGIDLTALEDIAGGIKRGEEVHLQGMEAYHYLHDKDITVEGGENRRLERQKQYLTAYAVKAMDTLKTNLTLPVTLYNILGKYMVTDISLDEVSYLVTQAADYQFSPDHVYSLKGMSVTDVDSERFYPDETALYELILDIYYEEVGE